MQDRIANTLIVAGTALLSVGAGLVYPPAGLIVFGAFCIAGGYLLARNA